MSCERVEACSNALADRFVVIPAGFTQVPRYTLAVGTAGGPDGATPNGTVEPDVGPAAFRPGADGADLCDPPDEQEQARSPTAKATAAARV